MAVVRTLLFAGWVSWTRERFDEAEVIWQRALALVGPKDHWARVRALTALSINRTEMKDPEGALKLIDEASALASSMSFRAPSGSFISVRLIESAVRARTRA